MSSLRALIVDDSRATRAILRRALVHRGFEVLEAVDGRDALDRLEQAGAVDLALVDWNMPRMTGYELLCAMRARRDFDRVAVMMVTTETEPEQMTRALAAGANEYVMKPFTEQVLGEKLLLLGLEPS